MRIFEHSDYNFVSLPNYAKVDCLWETGQFLENAADHLLDGCEMWTADLDEAKQILDKLAINIRRDAAKHTR